jgi:fructose-1,6-bisphosphatase/inositol monophosphatase family enzyme
LLDVAGPVITTGELLGLFDAAFDAQRAAVGALDATQRRARADGHAGQYALDVAADAAILDVLLPAGVAVVSEESGRSGPADGEITVVVDPVDGSTNCARGIPYWSISLCALDRHGLLCSLVANGATGERMTAVRGEGAWCDGHPLSASSTKRMADSVVVFESLPPAHLGWKQCRILGSAALSLCDLGAGRIDAWTSMHESASPWDYLGGLLVAREAGAHVVDASDRELVTADPAIGRTLIGAATPSLLEELRGAIAPTT